MSEQAAAFPLPESGTSEREALLEAGRLTGLGELVRGFAHEINNPLFGMLGLVELLLDDIEPGTKAHERLSLVQQSGLEIKRITHSLLGVARVESEITEIVSLQEVVESTVELVRCTSAGKSVELREQYPSERLHVFGSSARLGQIFSACSSTPSSPCQRGGTVTVELERDGDWAVARVTDTGPGIDPEARPRLIRAVLDDERGNGPRARRKPRDRTRARGRPEFALTSVSAAGVLRAPPPNCGGHGMIKILVIDDDAVVREVISEMLAVGGYEVVTASTAAEALELFVDEEIELVVSDIVMPDLSGWSYSTPCACTGQAFRSCSSPEPTPATTSARR